MKPDGIRQLSFVIFITSAVFGRTASDAQLSAATIDFEDLAVPPRTNLWAGDITSRGFHFDSFQDHVHLDRDNFRVSNGTTYLATDDVPGFNPLTMSVAGGGTFTLNQLDMGEWWNENATARTVTVTGNFAAGGSIVRTITLDLIFDGTFGSNDFQTFTFSSAWTNLTSVVFKGNGSLQAGENHFTLDNIVTTNVVPEPASLLMLIMAALHCCMDVRCRR
jgi:hypothetical protein